MTYKRIYELLKRKGHSPVKSAEIVLDAVRGDGHALAWVKVVFKFRHNCVNPIRVGGR